VGGADIKDGDVDMVRPAAVAAAAAPPTLSEQQQSMRTRKMYHMLKNELTKQADDGKGRDDPHLSFLRLVEGRQPDIVAGAFYQLLLLKQNGLIDVQQKKAYDDIVIRMVPPQT